ncbi:MAG TPA: imidazole glycerol phosphate synthase subunit HisH [Nitrospira sp.]|nr:imidazole glycerol phosphate synthase subunit HisH [Nitrospira sp.]
MIAIIDYGMGNLRSVSNAFEAVGHRAVVTRDPRIIADADRVVLPGVGAFGDCMANLERYGLIDSIRSTVQSGKPFLGICLGLQLLFTESEEFGVHKGLGIIPGTVRRFPWGQAPGGLAPARPVPVPILKVDKEPVPLQSPPKLQGQAPAGREPVPVPPLKVPHMGWNHVHFERACPLFDGIADDSEWYFVHSYFVDPSDRSIVATCTTYGFPFVSSIWRGNVVACQFHPEKSQSAGLRLIRNFGAWNG